MPTLSNPIPLVLLSAPSLERILLGQKRFQVRAVSGWPSLHKAIREARPDTVVVVDPYAQEASAPAPELFRLLELFPSIAVVGAFELTPTRVGDVRQMLQAGISGLVNLRIETTASLAARHFCDAVGRPFKRQVEGITPAYLSMDARNILRGACEVVLAGGGVDALADLFGVSQKTLSRWCQRFKLGTTRSLLLWIRLLLSAVLLEDRGRTVQSAARAAGYSSDRALRRAFEQALGIGPSTIRQGGAFACVSQAFRDRLAAMATGTRL